MTAGGTAEAWQEFGEPLKRFVRSRVRSRHDADDVLQEVFLKAHEALRRGRGPKDRAPLKAWLYRIAENAVADHHRARKGAALRREAGPGRALLPVPAEDMAEEPPGPSNANGEVIPCLQRLIGGLPEGYRRALTLADLEGRTQGEVA
jgi:RNA polymerase sigma-70 factor (ECF subfamily)